ncbi:MAG TPA: hypothetical protein VNV66_03660 [Pilimelia sp.]|nr:hypothetical protein [Pilimelia sp.]
MIGLLVSAALVWQSSQAAFTATTDNADNVWSAGTVTLTDNIAGTAWFNATGIKPGDSDSKCVEVTYAGSLAADIRLYGANHSNVDQTLGAGNGHLGNRINLTVQRGAVGATCAAQGPLTTIYASGPLDTFRSSYTGYANGIGSSTHTWTPAGGSGEARPYVFSWTLTDFNDAQGDTYEIDFVWEARNT